MIVESIRTASLGDTSYVVAHDGVGVVVDPQRDTGRFLDAVDRLGVTITHVLDTHVHNDYLSGAPALADELGADLVMPAGSGVAFAFVPAFHLEEIKGDGALSIRPLHTPGHTPEHTSYLILVDGAPSAVCTGGSLLFGSAGRTDLLGRSLADGLARLQHGSVHRLAELPGTVELLPTHGAGSFCASSAVPSRARSTIADEVATNPVLALPDVEAFVTDQLGGLLPYPDYYAAMAPLNRARPPALTTPRPTPTNVVDDDAWVVDLRPRDRYFAGHVPGSLNIEWGSSFAPWTGWLVPFGTPVHLVLDRLQDPVWAITELGRIGYEVSGVTTDLTGIDLVPGTTATAEDLIEALASGATVVDVRDPHEYETGHLNGSIHRYVPDLRHDVPGDARSPVWVTCASGFRASIAAGLVERAGRTAVTVTAGGVATLRRDHPELFVSDGLAPR